MDDYRDRLRKLAIRDEELVAAMLASEPTREESALDAKTGHVIMRLLRNIAMEKDRAVIIVTHDSRIFEFGDRIARMEDGHILEVITQTPADRAAVAQV